MFKLFDVVDLTLAGLKNLSFVQHPRIQELFRYLDEKWVGEDRGRSTDVRIGTLYLGRDEDDTVHLVVSLRWTESSEVFSALCKRIADLKVPI